ncbi:ABC transporter permease [Acuticoccus sp. I52.16.1]|uniref:ABC transporter permease n=1 Tax=Acuticoccus sp. I52.16.1 TaxID=2928472 RepID=UPI001FD0D000|nr:ABC transporter permease [Acuticoccus sp. I52.16.1]UOM34882.1 ABC transporter permease [Acuticoccus sp. I52.16.1]
MRRTTRSLADVSYAAVVWGIGGLAIAILTVPVLVVLAISLTAEASLKFPPQGLSLRWYAALLDPAESGHIHEAAFNSLTVAAWAAGLAMLIGTLAALWLDRRRGLGARALDTAFMSPLVLPMLSFGLATLIIVTMLRQRPSLSWLTVGHLVVVVPFVLRTVTASLSQLDRALIDSSRSLGASTFMTFRRIVLPVIAPGILAGGFLAFVASMDNVPISLFLSNARTDMLPIRLWGMMESTLDVRVAAASGLLILATSLLLLVMNRLVGLNRRM